MCGIVGAISHRDIVPTLLAGLKLLEYRGYDSAGLAVIQDDGSLGRHREMGKVKILESRLKAEPLMGQIGIAHTRWATHGAPNQRNAHPQVAGDRIVVVHNGIFENEHLLRAELSAKGVQLESDTDTEVVAYCIYELTSQGMSLLEALKSTLTRLEGSYAICVLDSQDPHKFYAVRQGCPLVIGLGEAEQFVASDVLALQGLTQEFIYLDNGDIAEVSAHDIIIRAQPAYEPVVRETHHRAISYNAAGKGAYRHFMLKEIYEQPVSIQETLEGRLSSQGVFVSSFGVQAREILSQVQAIQIVGCGTSYHAGLIARFWFEQLAGLPCQVEVASEFRYRQKVTLSNTLLICLSQSGETADTLAALRNSALEPRILSRLSICNVPESSLVRESQLNFLTAAGPEIGVCSTKAFTTQLTALMMLVLLLSDKQTCPQHEIVEGLIHMPRAIEAALQLAPEIKAMSEALSDKSSALFIGRGIHYPVALEGALKLKEISYIHAEAYPAGELKHGPLALVDKGMPVVVVAPSNEIFDKMRANMQEIQARGGHLLVFTSIGSGLVATANMQVVELPTVLEVLAPLLYSIPLQLLAYDVAVAKGTDVDQPRNLAKSVTVE